MTVPRSSIVDESSVGFFHCMTRCVRRAFLCGFDSYTGRDFSHRQAWVRDRVKWLSQAFAVDVFAYAAMSNHLHLVVSNRPDLASAWSTAEVARRWLTLFPRQATQTGGEPTQADIESIANDPARTTELRKRLSSISWFMRLLNQHIARRANIEDDCKGRFWEGRFKCQRLLDEAAILTCMAYVDLNPIRAQMVQSLTEPQFTSAYERIRAAQARRTLDCMQNEIPAACQGTLTAAQEALQQQEEKIIQAAAWLSSISGPGSPLSSISEETYLDLLDWTGREVRADKPGTLPSHLEPLLTQLDINAQRWSTTVSRYGSLFFHVAGRIERMAEAAGQMGRRWLRGISASREAFTPSPHAG